MCRPRANITMLYNEAPIAVPEEQNEDLRLILDGEERVTEMELNPFTPRSTHRSCDLMIMDKMLLEYLVEEAYSHGEYDLTRDILLKKCGTLKIMGLPVRRVRGKAGFGQRLLPA